MGNGRRWTAGALRALAVRERERGRYVRAARWHRAAAAIATRNRDPALIAFLNDWGVSCKFAGLFDEGESAYRRAVALGPTSEQTAVLAHNLGGLAHARGDMAAAEPHARRALELRRASRSPDHPDVAAELAALAPILHGLGRYAEAEAMFREALEIFGTDHREAGFVLGNLGALMQDAGHVDQAAACYEESLRIKERALGPHHPAVAITLSNLGLLRLRRGGDARAPLDRALTIMRARLAPDHPALRACEARRARCP
ncbi:tetratricopeptide repeat protein [Saccharopolyspora taberi]|uniref:Tetratricopeptide repeat protein n=1 Tax=Saccharopolyspora taberi TaxID=60895 RepID=A0ABN3VBE0_9PSEU